MMMTPQNSKKQPLSYWFLYNANQLLVVNEHEKLNIPSFNYSTAESLIENQPREIGNLNGISCLAANLKPNITLPESCSLSPLRPIFGQLEDDFFWMAAKAVHLLYWDRRSRFCGICGSKTKEKVDECAKVCEKCGEIYYPRIAPAIIVAIIKDGQILLARANRFASYYYSVLAGFVEPGESLEECAHREVMEEVGIRIKNLRYFGSQPWPFPDSLMIGFTADYESGTITLDLTENMDAGWYSPDNLPPTPGKVSIASRLIEWYLSEYGCPINHY